MCRRTYGKTDEEPEMKPEPDGMLKRGHRERVPDNTPDCMIVKGWREKELVE